MAEAVQRSPAACDAARRALAVAPWLHDMPQAESIRHNNVVYELRAAGKDVITLSLGEAFFDLPTPRFDTLPATVSLHHYSHSRGLPELRERLASYYRDTFDVPVEPAHEIVVTAGSKAAIYMLLLAILRPGDEVIILEPCWLSYPEQVRMCRGNPIMVPLTTSVFELGEYVTDRTRAIIVNNPNNPSGHVYSRAELQFIHELAKRRDLLVVADEAYGEFVQSDTKFYSFGALDPEKRHTAVVNSASKQFGISGWRIGYLIAHRDLIGQVLKINQHLITCAPTILSFYLAEHFEEILETSRPQIQEVVARRNRVAEWLRIAGVQTLPGSASFYLFVSLGDSVLDSTSFATRLLEESSVSVVAGIAYGASCDRYVRISVGTEPQDRLRIGVEAIRRLIAASCPGRSQ